MRSTCLASLAAIVAVRLATAAPADATGDQALATLKQASGQLASFVLDNGMTCLVKEDHSAPVVSIQIWVGSGSIHEDGQLGAGLSHYVEHMVFKGTPTRKPGDIAKTIIGLGGGLNAYTSLDRTVFHTDLPARHWKTGLATLADAVINASFPESEWGREKEVILRELSMGQDNPDRQLGELLFQTAYTRHPYRLPVIGLRDILKAVSRADLVDFYRRRYIPDNMVTVVVGDIDKDDARKTLTATFAAFARRPNPPVYVPAEPRQTAPHFIRKAGPYHLSRLAVAFHTVSFEDKDAPALDLLASIVGDGQSSRLVQEIKENRKLVHAISASSFTPRDPGLFDISAELDPACETAAMQAIDDAVASWSHVRFTQTEIEKARRQLLVSHLSALQTMHGQAASYAEGQLFMQDPRYAETYLATLQAVNAADLQAVARKYFQPENRVTVILGPDRATDRSSPPAALNQPSGVIRRKLPGGVSLILREDHRLPFVYVCAAFLGGTITEDESSSGISQLMASLLVRGTLRRSASDIATTLETLGADLAPFAGYNSVGLQGRCLAGDAGTLMDVLFDCLGHSMFPTNEVEKQKVVQLAELAAYREQPMNVARDTLNTLLFPGHPYRLNLLGSDHSIARLDQQALADCYRRQLVTGNMALAVFGDITSKEAESMVLKYIGQVRRDQPPARLALTPAPVLPARSERSEPREQCIVLYGFPGITLADPRRDALSILEAAMSGMSSRLFETVRDKRGLAYYASASQRPGLDAGLFTLYAGIRSAALPEVEALIRDEIGRVTSQGLEPEELTRAKNMIIASHEMKLQDNGGLAMTCALNELYGQGYDYEFTTPRRVEAVTAGQVLAAAASVLDTNKLAVSVVLPGTGQH